MGCKGSKAKNKRDGILVTTNTSRADRILKVIILGEPGVGKTSLVRRFGGEAFAENSISSLGSDFIEKSYNVGEQVIQVQLWDTGGGERFRAMTTSFYRAAVLVFLVYDITNKATLEQINIWVSQLQKFVYGDITKFLVGNKLDLEDKRAISTTEGEVIDM